MAIDANIYAQNMPDVAGSFEKGLTIRDMLNKRDKEAKAQKKEQDFSDAYNAGVTKNPDGSISYDGMKTASKLSDLGYGRESVETMQNYKAQQKASIEEQRKKISEATEYLGRASDALKQNPALYQNILQDAKARGFDVSTMPPQYGPEAQKMIDYYHGQALSNKDQFENQFKQQQFAAEQKWKSEDNNIKREELGIERQKAKVEGVKRSADDKKMGSYVTEGLRGIGGMRAALQNGDNTFSLVGDNDFTRSLTQMAENFGRMQSGGAINKDEEERFIRMAPGIGDSAEMQQKKLDAMETMFRERARTYGVDLDSAGISNRNSPTGSLNSKPSWAK